MILLLPFTLVLFSLGPFFNTPLLTNAGDTQYNNPCSVNNQKLQFGTYQFQTDCDAMTFCNSSNLCDHKGCRKDEFPFGYDKSTDIPKKCPTGFFCPDEEDACQALLAVDSPCQFNRDGKLLQASTMG